MWASAGGLTPPQLHDGDVREQLQAERVHLLLRSTSSPPQRLRLWAAALCWVVCLFLFVFWLRSVNVAAGLFRIVPDPPSWFGLSGSSKMFRL